MTAKTEKQKNLKKQHKANGTITETTHINKVTKPKIKPKKEIKPTFLKALYNHIDSCVNDPVYEYETKADSTDDLIYKTGAYLINYSLVLVPMLYYIKHISTIPRTCNFNDVNTYCFNNNETFCKNGYESKYTLKSGYGLIKNEKECIKNFEYEKQKNTLFELYNDKQNQLLFALRDISGYEKEGSLLNIDFSYLQNELMAFSNGSIKHYYPLKKINQRKLLNSNKIDRSKNKDSIFYQKKRDNNKKYNKKLFNINSIKDIL